MNNLFAKAPKELVTDAFFSWLFEEFEADQNLSKYKSHFLSELKIEGVSSNFNVTKTQLQEENTDLIIWLEDSGESKKILFENKTWSTIHSDQLATYKARFPDCHQYLYMKLGFIDFQERMQAQKDGYTVIGAQEVESALRPFSNYGQIITQYYQYMLSEFIDDPHELQKRILGNDSSVFAERMPQSKFLSDLHEHLYDLLDYTDFDPGANRDGTPWTMLDIAKTESKYGDSTEYITWRIDKKSNRYYVRLSQYSRVDSAYQTEKDKSLIIQRESFNKLIANHQLTASKPSNRGKIECEIGIFYFDENSILDLREYLIQVSIEFVDAYSHM